MAYRNKLDISDENIDFVEMNSPSSPVCAIQPRKLRFASPVPEENNTTKPPSVSPPYRKVRALRLFDTPATPKTILQKSSNHLAGSSTKEILRCEKMLKMIERPRMLPLHNRTLDIIQNQTANVNPFTPNSLLAQNKKRCRTQRENLQNRSLQIFLNTDSAADKSDEDQATEKQAPKRLALQDTNISRYQKEFVEVSLIGVGEFGLVYQCLNRLDGCIYAIKKSIKPVAGSSFEKRALNEVWAHAVLGKHDNVVRYYSAWAEDNHMLIQNEYCNGGSLQAFINKRFLVEAELKILLLQVAEGLRYIHSNKLVHMDLKSGNIFLTKVAPTHKISPSTHQDDGMDAVYEEIDNTECIITYKIGDLGHVTSVSEPQVEEGDCRYLPNEILQEDYRDLYKADIFSLGITLFEAAGGGPLPQNGAGWHKLRKGAVPNIPALSREFNDLIKQMTHPDPDKRPSSTSIFNHPILSVMESKTKSQLSQELAIEKRKNEILLVKLREAKKQLKLYENDLKASFKNSPEKRCLRSITRNKSRSMCAKKEGLRDRNKNYIGY